MAVCSSRVGYPAGVAILVALLSGALIGAINGFLVAVVRIPSFIVTLAALIFYSGLLLALLNGQATLPISNAFILAISGSPQSFLPDIYGVGLPALAVVLYAIALLLGYMRRRRLGLRTQSLRRIILQIVIVAVLVGAAVTAFESYNGVPYSTAILWPDSPLLAASDEDSFWTTYVCRRRQCRGCASCWYQRSRHSHRGFYTLFGAGSNRGHY